VKTIYIEIALMDVLDARYTLTHDGGKKIDEKDPYVQLLVPHLDNFLAAVKLDQPTLYAATLKRKGWRHDPIKEEK
jgi:hypothetical protein